MPIHKSPEKEMKKSKKNNLRNKAQKANVKNVFKKAVKASSDDEKKALLKEGYKVIDKAGAKKVIKKNKVARKKSQLAKMLAK